VRSPADSQALARTSPASLATLTDRSFRSADHLWLIDEAITDAVWRAESGSRGRPEIILVSTPPRHGKSTLISTYAPAWYLGSWPDRRVLLASYEADFAANWGAKARSVLERVGSELYGVKVSERSSAARHWEIEGRKGGMATAGVGGPITGRGANLFVIDDPIKNAEQAASALIREKHWEWWLSTARTRLEPGAVVLVVMTRWHEADLGGRLLAESKEGGDPVLEIRLPALAEENDPLGRSVGEALWPQRYSTEYLANTRTTLGPYWFSAMYQGRPSPDEGGIFDHGDFRYFRIEGDEVVLSRPEGKKRFGTSYCRKFQVADLAASESESADYTVIAEFWATPDGELLVNDVVRARVAVPDQPALFRKHHTGGPVKVESIGYQTGLVQTMLREGFPAEPVYPDADKVTRAASAAVLYRGEKVFHRAKAPWLSDFESELLAFPAGEHDDQVDVLAYAARELPNLQTTPYKLPDRPRRPHWTNEVCSTYGWRGP
jgi:predicted phage terminase large subunit-like protein